jgi:HTH-type transcriptional regulator / antitoxin HipB
MKIVDEISLLVKTHRKESGMSRETLSLLSGIGKTTIYDIENGKETVQLKSVLKILDTLNITLKFESRLR